MFEICLGIVIGYSILGWLVLTGIKINYGRLSNSLTSIYFSPRIGWFIFQVPNLLWAGYFLFYLQNPITVPYLLFILHYVNRDIIYPLRLKSNTKVPLQILLSAFSFTFGNGYLQGIANQEYQSGSIVKTVLGVAVFALGMWINVHSDNILQAAKEKLNKEGTQPYIQDQIDMSELIHFCLNTSRTPIISERSSNGQATQQLQGIPVPGCSCFQLLTS